MGAHTLRKNQTCDTGQAASQEGETKKQEKCLFKAKRVNHAVMWTTRSNILQEWHPRDAQLAFMLVMGSWKLSFQHCASPSPLESFLSTCQEICTAHHYDWSLQHDDWSEIRQLAGVVKLAFSICNVVLMLRLHSSPMSGREGVKNGSLLSHTESHPFFRASSFIASTS
jgi:hypothetical protein